MYFLLEENWRALELHIYKLFQKASTWLWKCSQLRLKSIKLKSKVDTGTNVKKKKKEKKARIHLVQELEASVFKSMQVLEWIFNERLGQKKNQTQLQYINGRDYTQYNMGNNRWLEYVPMQNVNINLRIRPNKVWLPKH